MVVEEAIAIAINAVNQDIYQEIAGKIKKNIFTRFTMLH